MLHTLQSTSNPTLEEIARLGAERMLAMALKAEIQAFIEQYSSIRNAQGKAAVIRNGYLPERTITTSAGPISVKVPRSRSTVKNLKPFVSALIPKYRENHSVSKKPYPCFISEDCPIMTLSRHSKSCSANCRQGFHRHPLLA